MTNPLVRDPEFDKILGKIEIPSMPGGLGASLMGMPSISKRANLAAVIELRDSCGIPGDDEDSEIRWLWFVATATDNLYSKYKDDPEKCFEKDVVYHEVCASAKRKREGIRAALMQQAQATAQAEREHQQYLAGVVEAKRKSLAFKFCCASIGGALGHKVMKKNPWTGILVGGGFGFLAGFFLDGLVERDNMRDVRSMF
jgi:ElaB/YqjD/DUF883 family membrane-anchored ribosome-binding protein